MAKTKKRKRMIGKFKYNTDWKKKASGQKNRLVTPICSDTVRQSWDKKTSTEENFQKLGLIFDLNKAMKPKHGYLEIQEEMTMEQIKEINKEKKKSKDKRGKTPDLISVLEKKSKLAKESKNVNLPNGIVTFITYLLDKYGEDYKAMAKDSRNYDQETWKQLRGKVQKFKNCTEQFTEYLMKRELLDS